LTVFENSLDHAPVFPIQGEHFGVDFSGHYTRLVFYPTNRAFDLCFDYVKNPKHKELLKTRV
jgi:hypothetical protein